MPKKGNGNAWGRLKKWLFGETHRASGNIYIESPRIVSMTWNTILFDATGKIKDAPDVVLSTIPNITLGVGETLDMSQYWTDNDGIITSTQILNLDTNVATYSDTTKLLTGVAAGTSAGLQLEVTAGLSASGVTGSIEADGQVTIAYDGVNGFGATGPTLAVYDDFRNGTVGQDAGLSDAVVGAWDAYVSGTASNWPHISSTGLNQSKSLQVCDSDLTTGARALQVQFTPATEFFVLFWLRLNQNWSGITGGKLKCTWALDGASAAGNEGKYDLIYPNRNTNSDWDVQGNDGYRHQGTWTSNTMTPDEWHRAVWWERDNTPNMDFYLQRLSPVDAIHDTETVPDVNTDMFGPFPNSTSLDRVNFPGFLDNSLGYWSTPAYMWYDCIYVASGAGAAARVEIGDNATYASCNYLDIATVDSWSNTSITCTLRQQSLSAFSGKYIHIHDADNNYVGSSRLIS